MASSTADTKLTLRRAWFQVHKWIGLILATLIIPLSLSGSALVWHDWVDRALNPERRVAAAPTHDAAYYAAAARRALASGETLQGIAFPDGEGAIVANATRAPSAPGGRPARSSLYLDPANGRVLDRASSDSGFVRVMHMLHGSLMVPGVGRQVVGWIGVAMMVSSLTGLWLWWPFSGGFASGLRWRRGPTTSANLHHQFGFWIALPLFALSLTGAWISFPAFFGQLSGDGAGGPPGGRGRLGGAPLEQTALSPDQALAAAIPLASGPLRSIAWPTGPEGEWTVAFAREGGNAEVKVIDATGLAKPPEPPRPETTARLMRRIHDGTEMGALWQTIIFLGGLIPAGLAVTGVLMWLNVRKRRAKAERNRAAREEASPV